MSKFYIAPTRKGRMLKIVEDVRVPVSDKLQLLCRMTEAYITKPRLVARFVNEDECREWLQAYNTTHDSLPFSTCKYACPQCGQSRIACVVEACPAVVEGNSVSLQTAEIESVFDTRRCTCLECGKHGYLCQWVVKDETQV